MESSRTIVANQGIVDSLSPVEFDAESESFRARYDSSRDSASLVVVSVIAAARREDPQALPPLQTVIDTDALDKLATESTTGAEGCDSVDFRYHGFEITVTSEDIVEANPLENTRH